jgi:hypothetical protein
MKSQTITTEPRPAAVEPLVSPPITDHFAVVEEKRLEMLHEWNDKIDALKASAAKLSQQAEGNRQKIREIDRFSSDGANKTVTTPLAAEADRMDQEARRLLNIELPKLQMERDRLASGNHPTLVALRIAAEGRQAADRAAKRKASPMKLPSFVILEDHFGWRENEQMVIFAEGQMVRDPALILKLIERGAPLAQ